MKKIFRLLKAIQLLTRKPNLLNLIIDSQYRWDTYIQKKYTPIKQLPTIQFTDIVSEDKISLNTWSFLGGGSMPTDILLLKQLASKIPACSYFEIGTWRGESVVNVSEIAKECYTLNLSEEEIKALGLSNTYAELHGYFSKKKNNITHLYGNSISFNFKKIDKKFDLIFIDGNHTYEYVKKDTQNVFKHLTHENSIIVWHDYAYDPEHIRSEVFAGILDGVPKSFHQNLHHVSNTKCAIFYPKKINSTLEKFPSTPIKNFEFQVTITSLKNESI
ncbi:class I SAM-dependent methyltransferase [Tenacibaculum agarivorans]|uniref:class I SAM-dependent methyltransferase n=1 Tax=Tenacibaculum agarivorans TaxID=1908389 RepID=UPI00094BB6E7|nr:class I SAM-dependent methyltransferase [Tenacibaculum agarivorans]